MNETPVTPVGGYAFISYVREDHSHVERVQRALEAAGIPVWRDTRDLWPGQNWREEIQKAITSGSIAFLACFSENSVNRTRSYQYEEISLAVDEMRQRPPGRPWLIPVRFNQVDLPHYDLGAGRTLASFQVADLFGNSWHDEVNRLIAQLRSVLPNPLDTLGTLGHPARLVERPRQERWWHDLDAYHVPSFPAPCIRGKQVVVCLDNLIYCLDADFGYALRWEYDLGDAVAYASSPRFWGSTKVGLTVLLQDGRYQAVVIDLDSRGPVASRRTLFRGAPYSPNYIFEDRYPVAPIAVGENLIFVSPYGHLVSMPSGRRVSLGRNRRIRVDCAANEKALIVHLGDKRSTWLEWRDPVTLEKVMSSGRYESVWGIIAGHIGTAPYIYEDAVYCGFGDRLVCFDGEGESRWEFAYPRIDALDQGEPLQVIANGEVVYQTTSEVTIAPGILGHNGFLYFILSEVTRHVSYVTKLHISDGRVAWTFKIEGFSGGLNVVDVSLGNVLVQCDTRLWVIDQDGRLQGALKLDMDCTSCSYAVRLTDNNYVVLGDLGIHEANLPLRVSS